MNRKAQKLKEYLTHKRAEREGVMKAGWHDEIWGVNLDEEVVETTHGYYCASCRKSFGFNFIESHINGAYHMKVLKWSRWMAAKHQARAEDKNDERAVKDACKSSPRPDDKVETKSAQETKAEEMLPRTSKFKKAEKKPASKWKAVETPAATSKVAEEHEVSVPQSSHEGQHEGESKEVAKESAKTMQHQAIPAITQQALRALHHVFEDEFKKDGDATGAAARALRRLKGLKAEPPTMNKFAEKAEQPQQSIKGVPKVQLVASYRDVVCRNVGQKRNQKMESVFEKVAGKARKNIKIQDDCSVKTKDFAQEKQVMTNKTNKDDDPGLREKRFFKSKLKMPTCAPDTVHGTASVVDDAENNEGGGFVLRVYGEAVFHRGKRAWDVCAGPSEDEDKRQCQRRLEEQKDQGGDRSIGRSIDR